MEKRVFLEGGCLSSELMNYKAFKTKLSQLKDVEAEPDKNEAHVR